MENSSIIVNLNLNLNQPTNPQLYSDENTSLNGFRFAQINPPLQLFAALHSQLALRLKSKFVALHLEQSWVACAAMR